MLVRPHQEHCVQFWSLLYKREWTGWRWSREGPQRLIQGLGSLTWEGRQGEHGKRRLRGDLITTSQYLRGGYQERCPFNKQSHGKIMGNGYKLLMGGFQLDTRGKRFTPRTISHWSISSGKWWIPQHWTRIRSGWTGCWAILPTPCFCQERLDQLILEVPSNLGFYELLRAFFSIASPKIMKLKCIYRK